MASDGESSEGFRTKNMREEIEELIFHMASLAEQIKEAKHPWPLKKAYAGHKRHLRKLFKIRDDFNALTAANRSIGERVPLQTPEPSSQLPTQDSELVLE